MSLTLRIRSVVVVSLLLVGTLILPLSGTAAAKKPTCPANTSGDFYVNPVVKPQKRIQPTGVNSPAHCAFPTITAALEALAIRGLGGRVIATGADAGVAVFANETFPLSIPRGVTLTSDNSDAGGPGPDPTKYVVQFKGNAEQAFDLAGGSVVGFTLKNERSAAASTMVSCDAASSQLELTTLDGATTAGGQVNRGLDLLAGCNLDANLLRVRNFADQGVVVAAGAHLSLVSSKVHNNTGDGIEIRGTANLTSPGTPSEIAFNGANGVRVFESTSADFVNMIVRDNGRTGFVVTTSAVSLRTVDIHNNSRSTGWNQPQLLFVGPALGGVELCNDEEVCQTAYDVSSSSDSCDNARANRILGYDPLSHNAGAVGVRAIDGAWVDARQNQWQATGNKTSVEPGSRVAFDTTCSSLISPDTSPPVT